MHKARGGEYSLEIDAVVFVNYINLITLPGSILYPLLNPSGFEGVIQSKVTSFRKQLSISTAEKNATDWKTEQIQKH